MLAARRTPEQAPVTTRGGYLNQGRTALRCQHGGKDHVQAMNSMLITINRVVQVAGAHSAHT